jgi:hypothetical protein
MDVKSHGQQSNGTESRQMRTREREREGERLAAPVGKGALTYPFQQRACQPVHVRNKTQKLSLTLNTNRCPWPWERETNKEEWGIPHPLCAAAEARNEKNEIGEARW